MRNPPLDHIMGRPSGYREVYDQVVEDFMRSGFSRMAAAGHIGVCYDTLVSWTKLYPTFGAAVKRGIAARALQLERELLGAQNGHTVASRIFALKNAAPQEWKDRHEHDHTSSDGSMSPPQIIELVAATEADAAVDDDDQSAG